MSVERFELRRVVVFSKKSRERSVSFLLHEHGRGWEIASLRKTPAALEEALSRILPSKDSFEKAAPHRLGGACVEVEKEAAFRLYLAFRLLSTVPCARRLASTGRVVGGLRGMDGPALSYWFEVTHEAAAGLSVSALRVLLNL